MSAIPANVLLGTSKEAAAYIQQIRTMRKDSPSFAKAADAQFLKQAYGWEDFRQGLSDSSPLSYGLAGAGGGGLLAAINELRRKKKHRNWWNVLKGLGIGGALGAGGAQLNEMFRPDAGGNNANNNATESGGRTEALEGASLPIRVAQGTNRAIEDAVRDRGDQIWGATEGVQKKIEQTGQQVTEGVDKLWNDTVQYMANLQNPGRCRPDIITVLSNTL